MQKLKESTKDPSLWSDHSRLNKINSEISSLEKILEVFNKLDANIQDIKTMLDISIEESDENLFLELKEEISNASNKIKTLELKALLKGELDASDAYLTIKSGAGGTEACDWAQMLMRLYSRWAERMKFNFNIMDINYGDEAGIKSVTIQIKGENAYGYLKCENGVHRLVRISPFDANARRHTSFAAVFATPGIDDSIDIDIKNEDLKIDTFRASGAGGQHVNKTDSAIRITHIPTGLVVSCQRERSQHANKKRAMKMLRSALYENELNKKEEQKEELNAAKKANEWGSQIRSYIMHPYRLVKDHRTKIEVSNVEKVMDGDIEAFIHGYLSLK